MRMRWCLFSTIIFACFEERNNLNSDERILLSIYEIENCNSGSQTMMPVLDLACDLSRNEIDLNKNHVNFLNFVFSCNINFDKYDEMFLNLSPVCSSCKKKSRKILSNCVYCSKIHNLRLKMKFIKYALLKLAKNQCNTEVKSCFFEQKHLFVNIQFLNYFAESSFSLSELKIVKKLFEGSNCKFYSTINENIRKIIEFHGHILNDKDLSTLFTEFIEAENLKTNNEIDFYLYKFNIDFYCTLSSEDLYKLIKCIVICNIDTNCFESISFIKKIITRSKNAGLFLDLKDLYRIIDDMFEHDCIYKLSALLAEDFYKNLLTSEKKIYKIIKKICKLKNENTVKLDKDIKIIDDFNDEDSTKSSNEEIINHDSEVINPVFVSEHSHDNSNAREMISTINNYHNHDMLCLNQSYCEEEDDEDIEDKNFYNFNSQGDSVNSQSPDYLHIGFESQKNEMKSSIISDLITSGAYISPRYYIKIGKILFSLLHPAKNQNEIFENCIYSFYEYKGLQNLDLIDIVEIISLNFIHSHLFTFIPESLTNIFQEVKLSADAEHLFDYIYRNTNSEVETSLLLALCKTELICKEKIDILVENSINHLTKSNVRKLLSELSENKIINSSSETLCIKKMLKISIQNAVELVKIFSNFSPENFTTNEINILFDSLKKENNFRDIVKFIPYLDFNKLEKNDEYKLFIMYNYAYPNSLNNDTPQDFLSKYLETPFFYYLLPEFLKVMHNQLLKESYSATNNDSYHDLSYLASNFYFQRCVQNYQREKASVFFNEYLISIHKEICNLSRMNLNFGLSFYSGLKNESLKISFKIITLGMTLKEKENTAMSSSTDENMLDTPDVLIAYCDKIRNESLETKILFIMNNFTLDTFELISIINNEWLENYVSDLNFEDLWRIINSLGLCN